MNTSRTHISPVMNARNDHEKESPMGYPNPHTHDLGSPEGVAKLVADIGALGRTAAVLDEIAAERQRQDAKWGEQNHPDGTGGFQEEMDAYAAKMACQAADEGGYVDWLHILREEVAEAFASAGPDLRAELLQVAAVAVAWIEAIDRRSA